MRRLLDAYRRWRHGRGYGVHSPWAYRIISEALRGKYAYYDDKAIDSLFGREARVARQVYRVLALDNCRVTGIIGGDNRWRALVDMASPNGTTPTLLIIANSVELSFPHPLDRVIIVSENPDDVLGQIATKSAHCLAVTNGRSLAVANLSSATYTQTISAKF